MKKKKITSKNRWFILKDQLQTLPFLHTILIYANKGKLNYYFTWQKIIYFEFLKPTTMKNVLKVLLLSTLDN